MSETVAKGAHYRRPRQQTPAHVNKRPSSGNPAVGNRSSIVHTGKRVVAVQGIRRVHHVPLPLSVAAGDLAVVTVAVGVAAVVTNVSSRSRAVTNRSSIVHNGRRVVAVNGIRTVEARTTPGMFILPIDFVRTFIIAI